MADIELDDSAEALQAKETEHAVPVGYWALLFGLVAWGVYYVFSLAGWDQAADLAGGGDVGGNIFRTVLFTALPTAIVIYLAVAQGRKKAGRGS
jgi:heme/copper-type cytochrome/quinol oxidase subunit 2